MSNAPSRVAPTVIIGQKGPAAPAAATRSSFSMLSSELPRFPLSFSSFTGLHFPRKPIVDRRPLTKSRHLTCVAGNYLSPGPSGRSRGNYSSELSGRSELPFGRRQTVQQAGGLPQRSSPGPTGPLTCRCRRIGAHDALPSRRRFCVFWESADYPPGTSKWNKIEHRLFSHITMNWRGRPLVSYQVIVNLIGATTTQAGLRVQADLDTDVYPTKVKVQVLRTTFLRDFRDLSQYSQQVLVFPPRQEAATVDAL